MATTDSRAASASTELRLFGVPALRGAAGELTRFTHHQRFQLLAFLACRRTWVERDELAEWLWPERHHASARSNLRKTLLLAQQVPLRTPLECQAERVRWQPTSDLQAFDAACRDHRDADALALAVAPLLQGLDAGPAGVAAAWRVFERERVEGLCLAAHRRLAAAERTGAGPGDGIGRVAERRQLHELLLQDACRLLTITGPGGVGKSCLARSTLAELAPQFAGGAFWIALDDLGDITHLPERLAAALGLALAGPAEPWAQIDRWLEGRPTLLVFDNAERVSGIAPAVAALLAACPQLKLIATSRARLALGGEWLLRLDGLPLPDADQTDAERLRQSDAVRLFEIRAQAARPGFDLAREAADVVRLLHLLDGLPLAIELAAWASPLPVEEVAAALAESPDRHDNGLRASFMHAWRLLPPAQRAGLAALAWLPGGFGRAMAHQVAQAPPPLLAALADRSLLHRDRAGRMSLHPWIRQGALACATECGIDAAALAARHADHMLHWLAHHEAGQPLPPSDDLATALPHLRSAWQWATAQPASPGARRCARRLAAFFGGCR